MVDQECIFVTVKIDLVRYLSWVIGNYSKVSLVRFKLPCESRTKRLAAIRSPLQRTSDTAFIRFFKNVIQGFPQAISDKGSEFIFLTPHLFPFIGGSDGGGVSLKSHKNYLRAGSVLKIYEPHFKILTPYGFLNASFLFLYLFIDFLC